MFDLILCSTEEEDKKFASGILPGFSSFSKFEDAYGAYTSADSGQKVCLLIDVDSRQTLEQAVSLVGDGQDRHGGEIHAIIMPSNELLIADAIESRIFENVILRRYRNPAAEGSFYRRVVNSSLRTGDSSIDSLFPYSEIHRLDFDPLSQKDLALGSVIGQLQEFQCSERVAQTIGALVDESILSLLKAGGCALDSDDAGSSARIVLEVSAESDTVGVAVHLGDNFARQNAVAVVAEHFRSCAGKLEIVPDSGASYLISAVLRSGASLRFNRLNKGESETCIIFPKARSLLELRNHVQFIGAHSRA